MKCTVHDSSRKTQTILFYFFRGNYFDDDHHKQNFFRSQDLNLFCKNAIDGIGCDWLKRLSNWSRLFSTHRSLRPKYKVLNKNVLGEPSTIHFLDGATSASLYVYFSFVSNNILQYKLKGSADCQSRRRARWPLDHCLSIHF